MSVYSTSSINNYQLFLQKLNEKSFRLLETKKLKIIKEKVNNKDKIKVLFHQSSAAKRNPNPHVNELNNENQRQMNKDLKPGKYGIINKDIKYLTHNNCSGSISKNKNKQTERYTYDNQNVNFRTLNHSPANQNIFSQSNSRSKERTVNIKTVKVNSLQSLNMNLSSKKLNTESFCKIDSKNHKVLTKSQKSIEKLYTDYSLSSRLCLKCRGKIQHNDSTKSHTISKITSKSIEGSCNLNANALEIKLNSIRQRTNNILLNYNRTIMTIESGDHIVR